MAKAYATRLENVNKIWIFDVESIDSAKVVFHDGSIKPCHGSASATHFWKTEEEAKAAVDFAKLVADKFICDLRREARHMIDILDWDVEVEKKN